MPSLAARALRTIRSHRMVPAGGRVLVAVSGGADSVALLHILRTLERTGELRVAGVAHFNHQLRGAESDADEQFCRELAAAEGVPFEAGRGDVAARARLLHRSIEDAARLARYEFLYVAADRLGGDAVAVGHTRDDQAETYLLRLIRGAGARGLGGVRPRVGRVVRPLIDIGRDELRAYAQRHGLTFREDPTNANTAIPRNRIRHELIPKLAEYSPGIVRALSGAARQAREDEEYLQSRAVELAASIVLTGERGPTIDVGAVGELPPALASRVVRMALESAAPGRFIGFGHIERVLELCGRPEGGSVSLPGITALRRGNEIVLGVRPGCAFSSSFRLPLPVPGEVSFMGWAVSAHPVETPAGLLLPPARGAVAVIAAEPLRQPLAVRGRRRGDFFRPLGMAGRGRKLQDYLVDRKIARAERDELPLVVDRDDRIVWVAGQSVAEDFRVTAPERGVILLKVRRLGGAG